MRLKFENDDRVESFTQGGTGTTEARDAGRARSKKKDDDSTYVRKELTLLPTPPSDDSLLDASPVPSAPDSLGSRDDSSGPRRRRLAG